MEDTRELCVLMAHVALECELYAEVIEALRPIFIQKIELTFDELSLLRQAFQKIALNLRLSMYAINEMEKKAEEEGSTQKIYLIQNYRKKLELEFNQRLVECTNTIHKYIYPYTDNPEARVQLLLMQIRFWLKLSEIARGPAQVSAISDTHTLFKHAKSIADAHLKITNPFSLEIILLYSVFLHDRLNNPYEAMVMGQQTYSNILPYLEELTEDQYKEISHIITQIESTYRHASYFVLDFDNDIVHT
jgi:hypothetical protein